MKKILLSTAVLLLSFLAYSQEAKDFGKYADFSLISRLDYNPYLLSNSVTGSDLGNSSIYTLFEGATSEHFSWTIANHWFHPGDSSIDTVWLYDGILRSDTTNWLDFFVANLSFGNWTFSLGKDMITTGGFEYEDWDWDVHYPFASSLWSNLPCYQWGVKALYTAPSEFFSISGQVTTSPYGERPFESGLYTFSTQAKLDYEWISAIASLSFLETSKNAFTYIGAVGARFSLSDYSQLTFDYFGIENQDICQLKYAYTPSERYSLLFHAAMDRLSINSVDVDINVVQTSGEVNSNVDVASINSTCVSLGAAFEYYPLKDSQDLRLHALLSYQSGLPGVVLSLGVKYNLVFHIF